VVREERQAAAAVESLGGYQQGLYAERWAPYVQVAGVLHPPCIKCGKGCRECHCSCAWRHLQGSCAAVNL
jgi:hypothetical protein